MFLVERNGSNPFCLSAPGNTLFSVQIVFGWKMLAEEEEEEVEERVERKRAGDFYCGHVSYIQVFRTGGFLGEYSKSAHILYCAHANMHPTV